MSDITVKPTIKPELKVERPRLYKVMLLNDDYTPRDFVVRVLKAEFGMTEAGASGHVYRPYPRALRGRGLHQGHRRDQGDESDRCRPRPGLPAAIHHRARRIAEAPEAHRRNESPENHGHD